MLLGAAAEAGLHGACLLGEMPHLFAQLPFPKASLAVLEVFTTITGIEIDFAELAEQAREMEEQLGELMSRVEEGFNRRRARRTERSRRTTTTRRTRTKRSADPFGESKPEPNEAERIEGLFGRRARTGPRRSS